MMKKKRFAKSFYQKRHLPLPQMEYWPDSAEELAALFGPEMSAEFSPDTPRILVGDGQHMRSWTIGERGFVSVRTTHCNKLISLDSTSNLVRVEAGIRWGDLRDQLAVEGLSLQRYRLMPADATVGGLLARHHAVQRQLFSGDLREGCVALSAMTPTTDGYSYIPAPRKASGPDLRYLFIGGEGLLGVILDATFVVWRPVQTRLYRWPLTETSTVVEYARQIFAMGLRPAWCHWSREDGAFQVCISAPGSLLESVTQALRANLGEAVEIGGADEAGAARTRLENAHPDRRTAAAATRTIAVTCSMANLAECVDSAQEIATDVQIHDWSAHAAVAYLTFDKETGAIELPEVIERHALEIRAVVDHDAKAWPRWSQKLKADLDGHRLLAVGP